MFSCSHRQHSGYLFESRWHAPAAGLHDAVITAHVLTNLPVLFTALLSAGQHRRVTEERRNTVTGQSGRSGRQGREEKKRKKRSVSSLASQQQETKRREMKKRRQVKASAITTAKQSSKMTKSNVQFSVLRHKRRKLEASVSVWLGGWCFCGFCVFTRQTFVVKKLRLRGNKRGLSGHKRASSELFSRQVWGFRVMRDVGKFSRRSLFREELQGTVGGGDLTHGVAASLRETGRWGRFVMDVDVAERPLDGRRAGWWAEETCEARRWTEREICLGYFFFFYITIESWLKAESHNCQMVDFFFSWMGGFSRDALRGKERWN